MADDRIASTKIAKLVRMLVSDKRTNPAAPRSAVADRPVTPLPGPAQG
ncbi:MAG: hypothetical protein ACRDRS_22820 [Pseudonocardiaceae bacterium]